MPVAPEAVWAALADPDGYGYWVVGSKVIRDADPDWPAVGAKFHHTIGVGPFTVKDHTEVKESVPNRYLRLRAKARPVGTATVILKLHRVDGGTRVEMVEHPDGLYAPLALNPLLQVSTRLRNAESLARLEELALRRGAEA
jgi:uncharacterized protein YndB with AHSA1/START domain